MKIIAQGAEAKITLNEKNNEIIKNRIKKSYRIPELDNKIRKSRTKAEKKLLTKANQLIYSPLPLNDKSEYQIKMPYIQGKKLSEHLDDLPEKKQLAVIKQVGKEIAKLHDNEIIHGDLTTSNMILVENSNSRLISKKNLSNNKQPKNYLPSVTSHQSANFSSLTTLSKSASSSEPIIFFIDFGLGYISKKIEDKAVDLHLLKQALEARHYKKYKDLWKAVEQGYSKYNSKSARIVLEQLTKVEKRGRYKH